MNLEPVILTGRRVRLEPLGYHHASDLLDAASHDEIWTWLDEPTPRTIERVNELIADAHEEHRQGRRIPWAVIDTNAGRAVGSTSFIDIRPHDRGVEIGWSWLTPAYWGRGISAEAKYLLLRYAFEGLDLIRVAIKTDLRNARSQRAIEGIGAMREGVWRNHRLLSDGYRRASVFYSVIAEDWPEVRHRLEERLKRGGGPRVSASG